MSNFEKYLCTLPKDKYHELIMERIERLNTEQHVIAMAREDERLTRSKLLDKLDSNDPDVNQMVFDSLRDMVKDECEHGRSYVKRCIACAEIDHTMFPELFDEDGEPIE